jgi:hypothetical protein
MFDPEKLGEFEIEFWVITAFKASFLSKLSVGGVRREAETSAT